VVILCGCGLLAWPALGAQSSRDHAGLCRSRGAWLSGMEIVCLWVISMAGLGGMAWQNGDHAGLCRPEGHSPAEWRLFIFGLPSWQALGTWPGRAEIMQAYTVLRGMAQWSGYYAGLCRPVQAWGCSLAEQRSCVC
jgi:hypothetical protein